ncbi:hypothetical protein [uncultured Corynebacterium sp.]|uniref:hypothetical protein n=1 Tax=uncultured Corynebacterium sp. TaxID=159447 RepID=UPI0025ED71DF|nr:hypothetical protein [uncultured Corynebacterium sp.]
MTAPKKPAFTDVSGVEVYAKLVDVEGQLRLKLLDENNRQILLLNFYDAKQLNAAVDMFLGQRYGTNFAELDGNISLEDRKNLFNEELEELEEKLKKEAEEEKARRAAEGRA